ncbi:MAG TPA: hypothetical protein VIJ85_00420 [Rhizomicrobium sp.]
MRSLRQWHQYISLFFAPVIFFFAFSGFLQLAGFHETHRGSAYKPAAWIVALSSLHQHQRVETDADNDDHMGGGGSLPLFKPFAVFMSWGLMLSSLLGMAIALTNPISRRTSLIVLIAGTLIPITLIVV